MVVMLGGGIKWGIKFSVFEYVEVGRETRLRVRFWWKVDGF